MSGTEAIAHLIGGRVNRVYRAGDTVRRKAGRWTPAVHRLLAHLHAHGFHGAPLGLGIHADGQETLRYVEGDAGTLPPPAWLRTDATIASVATLLSGYHDASTSFPARGDDAWFLPTREPREVICHGDIAPDNLVFRAGRAVALIDFDCAHPGPRAWDLAWAAYGVIPLQPATPLTTQAHLLRVFCAAYAHAQITPAIIAGNAIARLIQVAADVDALAAQGVPAFVQSAVAGHPAMFRAHAAHIGANAPGLSGLAAAPTDRYDADMYANYLRLVEQHGYRADRFLQLVSQFGGVTATRMGLEMPEAPGGFARLRNLGRLDHSVEAWCLRSEYAELFSEQQRTTARGRLAQAGFSEPAAATQAQPSASPLRV